MANSLKDIPIRVEHKPPNDGEGPVSLYEKHKKVYPRHVKGIFNNWRILFVIATQIIFLGLPWLTWNGRQAVYFDLVDLRWIFLYFFPFQSCMYL